MESQGISLGNLHGFELGKFRSLRHTVLAIVGEVAYVGDVSHIAYFIAEQ
jgi:hypothetical protein